MRRFLAQAWTRYRPCRRTETERAWMSRRYPHLTPPLPWTDGTF